LSDNIPYERAFADGCDAVIVVTMKGESEGGLYRNPLDSEHVIPESLRDQVVMIRPRHRLPVSFTDKRWPVLREGIELGRLRAREVLLGEHHAQLDLEPATAAPLTRLLRLLPAPRLPRPTA